MISEGFLLFGRLRAGDKARVFGRRFVGKTRFHAEKRSGSQKRLQTCSHFLYRGVSPYLPLVP